MKRQILSAALLNCIAGLTLPCSASAIFLAPGECPAAASCEWTVLPGPGFMVANEIALPEKETDDRPVRPQARLGLALAQAEGGLKVTEADPSLPAAQAGVKAGDLLLSLNGKPVRKLEAFVSQVRSIAAGEKARLTYRSGDKEITAEIMLKDADKEKPDKKDGKPGKKDGKPEKDSKDGGDLKHGEAAKALELLHGETPAESTPEKKDEAGKEGMARPRKSDRKLRDMDRQLQKEVKAPVRLGIMVSPEGDLIAEEVVPGSPAERAGLKKGDHILELNGEPAGQATDFISKLRSLEPDASVRLKWSRNGVATSETIPLASPEFKLVAPYAVPAGPKSDADPIDPLKLLHGENLPAPGLKIEAGKMPEWLDEPEPEQMEYYLKKTRPPGFDGLIEISPPEKRHPQNDQRGKKMESEALRLLQGDAEHGPERQDAPAKSGLDPTHEATLRTAAEAMRQAGIPQELCQKALRVMANRLLRSQPLSPSYQRLQAEAVRIQQALSELHERSRRLERAVQQLSTKDH